MSRLFLTGASGFVGSALLHQLLMVGHDVTCLSRNPSNSSSHPRKSTIIGDLLNLDDVDFGFLNSIDTVIHSAGRAHVMNEKLIDAQDLYFKVNYLSTVELALRAAQYGVKRFIFISTVKVNGESTPPGIRFQSTHPAQPLDFYSISKYRAERSLMPISREYGMEFVIIRPPLIYGPRCKGNFATLKTLVMSRLPLPLEGIDNSRSLISLDNLISFILLLVDRQSSPKASGEIFLVSDMHDYSTSSLVRLIAESMCLPDPRFTLSPYLLSKCFKGVGLAGTWQRLSSNLLVDSSPAYELLGWSPPFDFLEQVL